MGYACDGGSWGAFAAPAGTPAEVMEILRKAGETILNSEDFKATLAERGFDEYHVEAVQFKTDAQEMYGTNSAIIEEFNLSAN